MNVIIIEDEVLTAERLVSLLEKYDRSIHVIAQLESVEGTLSWFSENKASAERLDLIFMDIHLEDGDSFQIIKELQLKTPVIFTTAYDEYTIKAFKVNSIDYLLKPVTYEELAGAIDKFKSLKAMLGGSNTLVANEGLLKLNQFLSEAEKPPAGRYRERFMITVGTKIRSIKTADIAFFFLEEKTVLLTTFDNTTLPVDYSLDKLIQTIDPRDFFRINRQFIVSLNSIQLVHTYSAGKLKLDLKPKPRQEVFVSGDRITEFKEWLGK
jgi:DNA-binding LytR/AlgR family response regulator